MARRSRLSTGLRTHDACDLASAKGGGLLQGLPPRGKRAHGQRVVDHPAAARTDHDRLGREDAAGGFGEGARSARAAKRPPAVPDRARRAVGEAISAPSAKMASPLLIRHSQAFRHLPRSMRRAMLLGRRAARATKSSSGVLMLTRPRTTTTRRRRSRRNIRRSGSSPSAIAFSRTNAIHAASLAGQELRALARVAGVARYALDAERVAGGASFMNVTCIVVGPSSPVVLVAETPCGAMETRDPRARPRESQPPREAERPRVLCAPIRHEWPRHVVPRDLGSKVPWVATATAPFQPS